MNLCSTKWSNWMRTWAVLAASLLAGCEDAPTTPSGGGEFPEVQFVITAPKANNGSKLVVGGVVEVTGQVSATLGAQISSVQYVLGGGTPQTATLSGGNFSFSLDTNVTHPATDPKKCNKALNVSITATGSKDAVGSVSLSMEVDNCGPVLVISEPPSGPGLPPGVSIGKLHIAGSVKDTRLGSATLELQPLDENGEPIADAIEVLGEYTKSGGFDFVLDRAKQNSSDYRIVLRAVDLSGNASEVSVGATVLRQPSFLGNTDDGDQFGADVRDAAAYDWNGDGVLDEVVVGQDGLFLRMAKTVVSDEDTVRGTGRFESLAEAKQRKNGFVEGLKLVAVQRADLDGVDIVGVEAPTGDDLVAIGTGPDGPAVFGLLAVRSIVQEKQPDGGTQEVPHYGFVLVDSHALAEDPLSLALAPLNKDERIDVIVGSATENKGLTTIMGIVEPQCTIGGVTKSCLEFAENLDNYTKVTKATLFSIKDHRPEHKGVTQITSIAVGDFYRYDQQGLVDVCVGEAGRPYVSCYHNLKGDGQLEQAQDSWYSPDTTDTTLILAAEWSNYLAPDDVDLVVATQSKAIIRWLRGNGDGTFSYDPGKERAVLGIKATSMVLADVGTPKGQTEPTPYIVAVTGSREGTVLPLYPDDNSHVLNCFRSWIFGGQVLKVLPGDYDNDGIVDLLSVDSSPAGTTFLQGSRDTTGARDGGFVAPNVFHVCSSDRDSGGFGTRELRAFEVSDVTSDQMPEIAIWGEMSGSVQPCLGNKISAGCCPPLPGSDTPKLHPVWPMHLYMNLSGITQPQPRAGEFNPYKPGNKADGAQGGGVVTNCEVGEATFGNITDLASGDLDNDGGRDVVVVRDDASYTLGPGGAHPVCTDRCVWAEKNEYDNLFGPGMPSEPAQVGGCCRNYSAADTTMTKMMVGFGAGAPLPRASAMVFLSKNIYNLPGDSTTIKPGDVIPVFAISAGRNPKGVALHDIDGDNLLDLATVMDGEGSPSADEYLEPRVRSWRGLGATGKFEPAAQSGDVRKIFSNSGLFVGTSPVSYRVVEKGPVDILGGPFGDKPTPAFLVLSGLQGNTSVLLAGTGSGVKLAQQKLYTVGADPKAFTLADLDNDGISDLFATVGNAISFAAGNGSAFASKINLAESANALTSIAVADVNRDNRLDVITLDTAKSEIQVFLGSGTGNFATYAGRMRVAAGAKEVRIGDSEDDGCTDIYVRSTFGVTRVGNLACAAD